MTHEMAAGFIRRLIGFQGVGGRNQVICLHIALSITRVFRNVATQAKTT